MTSRNLSDAGQQAEAHGGPSTPTASAPKNPATLLPRRDRPVSDDAGTGLHLDERIQGRIREMREAIDRG